MAKPSSIMCYLSMSKPESIAFGPIYEMDLREEYDKLYFNDMYSVWYNPENRNFSDDEMRYFLYQNLKKEDKHTYKYLFKRTLKNIRNKKLKRIL